MPRSLGGGNEPENIVRLTPREHFIAHLLLAKIHGGSMWAALAYMSRKSVKSAHGVKVTGRIYDMIKREDAAWRSIAYAGENNYWYGKNLPESVIEKMRGPRLHLRGENNHNWGVKREKYVGVIIAAIKSYSSLSRFDVDTSIQNRIDSVCGVMWGRTPSGNLRRYKTPELRELSQWYRGVELGEKAKARDAHGDKNPNYGNGQAISGEKNPMWGKEHRASTKAKIGEKSKRRIECPHCGKDGNIANMHRWHLDNCRNKPASLL